MHARIVINKRKPGKDFFSTLERKGNYSMENVVADDGKSY
jgi:hypothetical protein